MGSADIAPCTLDLGTARWRKVVSFTPDSVTTGERPPAPTHFIGDWVSSRTTLEAVVQSVVFRFVFGIHTFYISDDAGNLL